MQRRFTLKALTAAVALAGAGASFAQAGGTIKVEAIRDRTNYGICSTDFLEKAFRTDSYRLQIDFQPDGSWKYVEHTMMTIPGRDEPFDHRDENHLFKVGEPDINPLLQIVREQGKS